MLIALDYDNTYTLDPIFWDSVIEKAKERGHRIITVTMRREGLEGKIVALDLGSKVDDIIFTDRAAKKPYLARLNIFPDVWIDDMPEWIIGDAAG